MGHFLDKDGTRYKVEYSEKNGLISDRFYHGVTTTTRRLD